MTLSDLELQLFQNLIHEKCGIEISDDKAYLIESRLAKLLVEMKFSSFGELFSNIYRSNDEVLVQKLVNAITTNETLWFRDKTPWEVLEKFYLPRFIEQLRSGERDKIRIWSAAASTGQEAYSTAMCIERFLELRLINDVKLEPFEIVGSDVSDAVLQIASRGIYDAISITRGLDEETRERYFTHSGNVWTLNDKIKNAARFMPFNLLNSFATLGKFDVIFCRYVFIYFSEKLKLDISERLFDHLDDDGVLFLGSYESCPQMKGFFEMKTHDNAVYYTKQKKENA